MDKKQRPKVTEGTIYKVVTGCGSIYITPARDKGELVEVFATLGKAGGCAHCQLEAITRSISLGLKYNVPVREFVRELKGLRCPGLVIDSGKEVLSCPDAIAGVLEEDARKHSSTNKVPKTK